MGPASAAQILEALGPSCRDTGRRELLLAQPILNGIDFIEFEEITVRRPDMCCTCISSTTFRSAPMGFPAIRLRSTCTVAPGSSGIKVPMSRPAGRTRKCSTSTSISRATSRPYLLSIGWRARQRRHLALPVHRPRSPVLGRADQLPSRLSGRLRLRAGRRLPARDARRAGARLPRRATTPASGSCCSISWRSATRPGSSAIPADLGIALLELFAYEGDHHRATSRTRSPTSRTSTPRVSASSAKRHARLVDYQMHDGRNAWAFVH